MRRARTQTLTVNDSVDINHNVVTESDNQINLEIFPLTTKNPFS